MLFLRSLEIFISSREINLCRLDTSPYNGRKLSTTGYLLWDYFEFYSVCSCSYTQVSNRHELPLSIAKKNRHCQTLYFFNKACGVFQECRTDFLCEFVYFMWHIIASHHFAIRKVSFNTNKGRLSVMNLRSRGPVASQPISVKVKYRIPFFRAYSTVIKR